MRFFLFLLCFVLSVWAERDSSSIVNPEVFKDSPEFITPKNQFPESKSRFLPPGKIERLPPETVKQLPPADNSEEKTETPAVNTPAELPCNLIGLSPKDLFMGKEKPALSAEEINDFFRDKIKEETKDEIKDKIVYPQAIGFDENSVLFREKYQLPQNWYEDMDKYGEEFRKFSAEMRDKKIKEMAGKIEDFANIAPMLEKKAHEDALFYFEQKKPALYEEYQELLSAADALSPEEFKKMQEEFFAHSPGLRDELRTIREIRAEKHLMQKLQENNAELYDRLVKLGEKFAKLSYKQKLQLTQKLLRESEK